MTNNSRIPRTINEFNNYIRDTDNYLQTVEPGPPPTPVWQRLGLSNDAATGWHDARLGWDVLFGKYTNPNTKTKSVNAQVADGMEIFRAFAQPLLDIMDSSPNATQDDAEIFRFKIGRSEPTHPTVPIADQCYADVETLGGGVIKVSCRTITDAKRASMAQGANLVQVAIKIGGTPPENAFDGTSMIILGKASEIYNLGAEHKGKTVYAFFRWYNTRYPHLAGPYNTQPVSFLVS